MKVKWTPNCLKLKYTKTLVTNWLLVCLRLLNEQKNIFSDRSEFFTRLDVSFTFLIIEIYFIIIIIIIVSCHKANKSYTLFLVQKIVKCEKKQVLVLGKFLFRNFFLESLVHLLSALEKINIRNLKRVIREHGQEGTLRISFNSLQKSKGINLNCE